MQVSGLPFTPELTGVVTGINYRSAVPTVGNLVFPSSANTLNQLQHAIQWGQASNLMGNPRFVAGFVLFFFFVLPSTSKISFSHTYPPTITIIHS